MKPRNVRLFNRTIPLIPLIVALVVGSVVIGYATNGFLTLITNPVQQATYHREDTITIVEIPEYIEAFVTLEGETNELDEFILGKPISVDLVITSLRPDFMVSDDYVLTIDAEPVLSGLMVNVEPGLPHTHSDSWTPLAVGSAVVALDITNMVWTTYVTFTEFTFLPDGSALAHSPLHINTLPIGTPILGGSTVTFDLELLSTSGTTIYGLLYDIDVSPDGGTTWSNVLTDGKEWNAGEALIVNGERSTFSVSFTAPLTAGDYIVRYTVTYISNDPLDEPGT